MKEVKAETILGKIDMEKWQYHPEDGVYWQVGICYCENPADIIYETMGIFMPGAYFTSKDNGDGAYTCDVNSKAVIGSYTAQLRLS